MSSKTRRGRVGKGIAQTLDTGMQQYTIQPKVVYTLRARADSGIDKKHPQTLVISKTVRTGGRGSPHKSKQNWDSYEVDGVIRRLTPLECERLQGFPDDWTLRGSTEINALHQSECNCRWCIISDTQRYKCLGNAVTVNVIRDIMIKICTSDSASGNSRSSGQKP